MPAKIQNADASIRLQRKFGLFGKLRLLLDEVIVPVVIVDDVTGDATSFSQDVVYFFGSPAVVANVGKAVLFNGITTDTNRDIIIDRIIVSASVTTTFSAFFTTNIPITPIPASTLTKVYRADPQVGIPPGNQFSDSGGLVGPRMLGTIRLANTPFQFDLGVRLGNQRGLIIQPTTQNLAFNVSMFGRVVPRL